MNTNRPQIYNPLMISSSSECIQTLNFGSNSALGHVSKSNSYQEGCIFYKGARRCLY